MYTVEGEMHIKSDNDKKHLNVTNNMWDGQTKTFAEY